MTPLFIWLILYQYYQVNGLATEVRLSQSGRSYEGIIEVLVNGTWGPIAGGVDSTTAKTICKILGHGFTGFAVGGFFVEGQPLLKGLSCKGYETSIQECTQYPMTYPAGLAFFPFVLSLPGIHCFAQVFSDLRLIDGEGPNNGTVNIKMDGRWGMLCGPHRSIIPIPTPKLDLVICRTLGYQRTLSPDPRYGSSSVSGLSLLDVVGIFCNGNETNLHQCTFTDGVMFAPCDGNRGVNCITLLNEPCTSDDICAAVANAVCKGDVCKCRHGYLQTHMYMCTGISQMIRLDPSFGHNNEFFLQMNYDGEWTYISNFYKSFSNTTAKMICKAFGFGNVGFSSWLNTYFVDETKVTSEGRFACRGTENSLEECITLDEYPQRIVVSGETPVTTLHCFARWINDLRLTDGQTSYHGNLEVKFGDRWGPVCAAVYPTMVISAVTERVICKSLWNAGNGGYLNATVTSNNTIPWISYLNCEATHTDINQCNYTLGPPQGKRNDCHDTGFVNVRCPNCEMGLYGSNCTHCDRLSTDACDMFTGACNCEPGWTDDTCLTDICSISDETCPEHSKPGYYICEFSPGYVTNSSFCEGKIMNVCDDGYYGQSCSQVWDCELKNVDVTINKRPCDSVTGRCACKSDWIGRSSDIVLTTQSFHNIKMISLAVAGCLLLLMIIVTVCVYKYRNGTTYSGPASPKERSETLKTGKSSHYEHNATMPSADGADYNTINDCMVDVDINADTDYDIHPDLLKRTERSDGKTDEGDGNDSDGYLKPAPTNTGTGSDTLLETDNDGYVKLGKAKRQLPGVPIDDRMQLQNPYESLKDRRQVEHEYITMDGNKI